MDSFVAELRSRAQVKLNQVSPVQSPQINSEKVEIKDDIELARRDLRDSLKLYSDLVNEGQRHSLPDYLASAGFACLNAEKPDWAPECAQWANQGLVWLREEIEAERVTMPLAQKISLFMDPIQKNRAFLAEHGLDETLLDRVLEAITQAEI